MECECGEKPLIPFTEIKTEPDLSVVKEEDPFVENPDTYIPIFPNVNVVIKKEEDVQDNEEDIKKFKCGACEKFDTVTDRKLIVKHFQTVHDFDFEDDFLERLLQARSILDDKDSNVYIFTPSRMQIPKYSSLRCDICVKIFSTKNEYKQHIQDQHENHEFICRYCKKTFIKYRHKREHVEACKIDGQEKIAAVLKKVYVNQKKKVTPYEKAPSNLPIMNPTASSETYFESPLSKSPRLNKTRIRFKKIRVISVKSLQEDKKLLKLLVTNPTSTLMKSCTTYKRKILDFSEKSQVKLKDQKQLPVVLNPTTLLIDSHKRVEIQKNSDESRVKAKEQVKVTQPTLPPKLPVVNATPYRTDSPKTYTRKNTKKSEDPRVELDGQISYNKEKELYETKITNREKVRNKIEINYQDAIPDAFDGQIIKPEPAHAIFLQYSVFICQDCPLAEKYTDHKDLIKHIQEYHFYDFPYEYLMTLIRYCYLVENDTCIVNVSGIGILKYHSSVCVLCDNKKFTYLSEYKTHIQVNHNYHEYKCPECSETFVKHHEKLLHMKIVHCKIRRNEFSCNNCANSFITAQELLLHRSTAHKTTFEHPILIGNDGKFKCKLCTRTFKWGSNYRSHLESHSTTVKYSCEQCGLTFNSDRKFAYHKQNSHVKQELECDECEKTFPSARRLQNHKKVHSDTFDFICEICSKGFRTKQNVDLHREIHFKEPPKIDSSKRFKCLMCPRSYEHNYQLTNHIKVTHEGQKVNAKASKKTYKSVKKYGCSICGRQYLTRKLLVRHQTTTKLHEKFECSVCSVWIFEKTMFEEHMEQFHKDINMKK